MRYLVSLDTKNNYIDISQGYIAYTMKKVNVNKILVSWICVDANISIKFMIKQQKWPFSKLYVQHKSL